MLGIVLGAIGLITLIELFPRLSASAASPSDPNNVLNSRFTVSNEGYLELDRVKTGCYISRSSNGLAEINKGLIADNSSVDLHPIESVTVPCTGPNIYLAASKADLMLVVYYHPWPFVFIRSHRFFRFVSRNVSPGVTVWEKQPSQPVEQEFNDFLNAHTNNPFAED